MNTKDMTKGQPFKLLLSFALPLMIGNVFQQAYIVADTAIVGQGVGINALASLGAGDWLYWLVLGIIEGFTQGFSIEIAQAYGENNEHRLSKAIYHSLILSIIVMIIVFLLAQYTLVPTLQLLQTPTNVINGTILYLKTIYYGIFFTTFYNLFASILRALGDSKTPLYIMVISSICNIILDYVLIYTFHLGIRGAAIATVLSQGLSAVLCFYILHKTLKIHKQSIDISTISTLLKLGLPMGIWTIMICLGGLIVQMAVNTYGMIHIAGFTATNKLYGLIEMAALAFGYGISTYTSQNYGAKKFDRIDEGEKVGMIYSILISLVVSMIMIVFGRYIVQLFIDTTSKNYQEVLSISIHYLHLLSYYLPILYVLYLYKNILQGLGYTTIVLISAILELFLRILSATVLSDTFGFEGVLHAEILAWIGGCVILVISYYIIKKRVIHSHK